MSYELGLNEDEIERRIKLVIEFITQLRTIFIGNKEAIAENIHILKKECAEDISIKKDEVFFPDDKGKEEK
jgi:hypothetical protein